MMSELHDYQKYPELSNAQLADLYFDSPHPQITEDFYARVIKVHDGDTISLATSFRDFVFPLRFSDIDSPELNAGGDVARDWLKDKLTNQDVQIKIDKNNRVEKYGRLLGRVEFNGMDVGQEEIYLGLAKPFGFKTEGEVPSADRIFALDQWF